MFCLALVVQRCNGDTKNKIRNWILFSYKRKKEFQKSVILPILKTYRNKNWRFDCILNKRSLSWRWCRFMLNVLASVIKIKSSPKLKPVHRHFWKPCSWSIRPHRKHVSKKTLLSLSWGLKEDLFSKSLHNYHSCRILPWINWVVDFKHWMPLLYYRIVQPASRYKAII